MFEFSVKGTDWYRLLLFSLSIDQDIRAVSEDTGGFSKLRGFSETLQGALDMFRETFPVPRSYDHQCPFLRNRDCADSFVVHRILYVR